MMNWLKGKKTYITMVAMFIAGGLLAAGIIEQELYNKITTFLVPLAIGFIRSAIKQ
jgi:hypothetical protein